MIPTGGSPLTGGSSCACRRLSSRLPSPDTRTGAAFPWPGGRRLKTAMTSTWSRAGCPLLDWSWRTAVCVPSAYVHLSISRRYTIHTGQIAITTLPFFLQLSTYLCASTICSKGYVLSITGLYFPASISSLRRFKSSILLSDES